MIGHLTILVKPHCARARSLFARFAISTYTPLPGQWLWNEALVCPLCGELWARKFFETPDITSILWKAHEVECGQSVLSISEIDHFLRYNDLTREQKELLVHDYPAAPSRLTVSALRLADDRHHSDSREPDAAEL